MINPMTGLPQLGGLICPFNADNHGPAKKRIHCLVFDSYEDWDNEGKDYHGPGTRFCEKNCHYGNMTQSQMTKARQMREGYRIRARQRSAWAKQVRRLRMQFPKLEVHKVASWPKKDAGKVK